MLYVSFLHLNSLNVTNPKLCPCYTAAWVGAVAGALKIVAMDYEGIGHYTEMSSSGTSTYTQPYMVYDSDEFCAQAGMDSYDGDCAELYATLRGDMEAVNAEQKGECFVSGNETFSVAQTGNTLSVGPFDIALDGDGNPTAITADGGDFSATINSIVDTEFSLGGCDVRRHTTENRDKLDVLDIIGSRRRALAEGDKADVHDHASYVWYTAAKGNKSQYTQEEAARKLDLLADFLNLISGTYWCGPGTNLLGGPDPGDLADVRSHSIISDIVEWAGDDTYTERAEWACYKHDSGAACVVGGTFPVLGCDIDMSVWQDANAWYMTSTYGVAGIAGLWGCVGRYAAATSHQHWGWRHCGWRGCSWTYLATHGTAATTAKHYGPWRYGGPSYNPWSTNINNRHIWGYIAQGSLPASSAQYGYGGTGGWPLKNCPGGTRSDASAGNTPNNVCQVSGL